MTRGQRGDPASSGFKEEFVVGWGREWRMSRRAVLEWLGTRGVDVAAVLR